MKDRLLVSFSGGSTSAMMSYLLSEEDAHDLLFVFANTGQEEDATIDFVHQCDERFNLGVVWVEAVVNPESGKGTRHKVVSYGTATRINDWRTRSDTPFEDVIRKYGIPNKAYPHCTRELKLQPIHSFAKEHWGGKSYKTAIGIRIDEDRRATGSAQYDIVYPLIDRMIDKIDVNNFWEEQDFKLELPAHRGNCATCWKKSDKKLYMIMNEAQSRFDFNHAMEQRHGFAGANDDSRVFFRQHRSTEALRETHATLEPESLQLFGNLDANDGCGESCELYDMEEQNENQSVD